MNNQVNFTYITSLTYKPICMNKLDSQVSELDDSELDDKISGLDDETSELDSKNK